MSKIVTFGELMLRLSPPGFERLLQSPMLVATFGGGEANVAVSVANFGLESVYVTALPKNAIGDAAIRALRAEGVRTDHIVRSGDRIGIYFAETGASQRASTVLYDRANSAISQMAPDAVDWATVMSGAAWLHVTGITPALGERGAASTARAIAAAKAAGARVSADLNYRKKLWTEAKAKEVMGPMMRNVDVVIANEEDLQSVLGVHVPGTDVTAGQLNLDGFRKAAEQVTRDFGPPQVAITLRESLSASDNGWSAVFWDANEQHDVREPAIPRAARRSHRRRRQLRRRIDLRPGHRTRTAGGAAFRRRGERAEADNPGRLQPGVAAGSGSAGRGRCVGSGASVASDADNESSRS